MSLMLFSSRCIVADLKTTEEKLDVYVGEDLVPVASFDRSKLKLGSELGAAVGLEVQGCAKVSKAVALSGEQFGSSNISMSGTWATGYQRVSGNHVALDSSTVLAGSGAGNIVIELPLPSDVPCQWFFIKKVLREHDVTVFTTAYIDSVETVALVMGSGFPSAQLFSDGQYWYLMNSSPEVKIPNWSPKNLDSWLTHFDGSALVSSLDVGDEVEFWLDQGPLGQDLSLSSAGHAPTLEMFSGTRSVLSFTGGSHLQRSVFHFPESGDVAIFIVAMVSATNSESSSLISVNTSPPNLDWQLEAKVAGQFHAVVEADGIGSNLPHSPGDLSGQWHLYELVFDHGAGRLDRYIDAQHSAGHNDYHTAMAVSQRLRLFSNRSATKDLEGYCAEVVIGEDVTAITRQNIEGYLMWKWGLADRLPTAHPHHFQPPAQ
jgi:hypothetical protein